MEINTRYIESVGRRKTAYARVRLTPTTKQSIIINEKPLDEYFTVTELCNMVLSPFNLLKTEQKFKVTVLAKGGGMASQADAIRLGISRAFLKINIENRGKLKAEGFLKRDPRAKERRKFGLKKARKAPQWSKR